MFSSMIKQEQKDLADYLKQVHLSLRRKARQIGAEKAWEEHLGNDEVLRNYSVVMKKLAEEYWAVNNQNEKEGFLCRIEWMINCISEYFEKGLIEKEMEKEKRKIKLFFEKQLVDSCEFDLYESFKFKLPEKSYKLLDVGSCYNPFGKYDFLDVYPIDLYPARPEVKMCNFLEVKVEKLNDKNWFQDNLQKLPSDFFDIVVFSLFLEYLPSPKQRYIACVRAYESLKINGLLLIATPDSKHSGANAAIMKNWKISAAQIGFVRCRLEKLKYLYCMAFRKSVLPKYPLLLNNIKEDHFQPEEMFIIPQDLVDYELEEKVTFTDKKDESETKEAFNALPFS